MKIYFPIHGSSIIKEKIKYTMDIFGFTDIDNLKTYVEDYSGSLNNWYYIELDSKIDKFKLNKRIELEENRVLIKAPFILHPFKYNPIPLFAMDRIWKRIPNFSRYLASNLGEILTLKTGYITKGVSAGHYLKVAIIKDGEETSTMQYVHRLICITFHGNNDKENYVVMHLDSNRENNKAKNLRWGSQSENIKDHWKIRKKNIIRSN